MRWWRLHKPVTIKDLNKVLTLGYGVELEEDNVIVVKQGTSLFGRPVHHWYIHLKGKREGNSIKLTHWWVEEESLDSIHFHSPLVKYMFGDMVKPFKTPWYEKREMAHAAAQYLKRLDDLKKIKTKYGELWEDAVEQIKRWFELGFKVYHYSCPVCSRRAFINSREEIKETRCSKCSNTVPVVEVKPEDLGVKQDAVQVNVLDNSTNTAQRRQHMPSG